MNFFDGWRALNSCLNAGDLTAPTQLIAYKLFAMFDEQRFPESLPVSDRDLMSRTNLKSTRTIVEARRQLKNAGLLDFKTERGKPTSYTLKLFGNTFETQSKHLVNTSETPEANSNIRARAPLTAVTDRRSGGRTGAGILKIWQSEAGFNLTGTNAAELERLVDLHGEESVRAAIVKAVATKRSEFVKFEHVKAILKGGTKCDTNTLVPCPVSLVPSKGGTKCGTNTLVPCPVSLVPSKGGETRVRVDQRPVDNRPDVRAVADRRATGNSSAAESSGKGRFDDAPPDTAWIYACAGDA